MRNPLLFLACALGSGIAACGGAPISFGGTPDPVWSPIPSDAVLYYDNSGGVRDTLRLVVRDAATLREVWAQATAPQAAPPPEPSVDFQREMLLVVAAGRMTPEDQIQVDSVGVQPALSPEGKKEDVLTAVVRILEGCRRFEADAYPLQIVRVRRFNGRVSFIERRERATDCRDD